MLFEQCSLPTFSPTKNAHQVELCHPTPLPCSFPQVEVLQCHCDAVGEAKLMLFFRPLCQWRMEQGQWGYRLMYGWRFVMFYGFIYFWRYLFYKWPWRCVLYIYICIFINIYYMYIYIYLLPFPKVQGVATSQLRWGETALELRCFQIFQSFYWN